MQIKAKVKEVRDTTEIKNFSKRELIVTIDYEQEYPQDITIEFWKDNTKLLDGVTAGDVVNIDFNIKGNYYEPKNIYFTKLVGYRISNVEVKKPEQEEESPF